MIKRSLRHFGGFQQLAQAHADKTTVQAKLLASSKKVFAGIVFSHFVHALTVVDQSV